MKKIIKILIIAAYITFPSVFAAMFIYFVTMPHIPSLNVIWVYIIGCYALTISGFFYYFWKKPFNQCFLCLIFMSVPLVAYVFETALNRSGRWQYLSTFIVTIFYAIPFTIIAFIIAVIVDRVDRVE